MSQGHQKTDFVASSHLQNRTENILNHMNHSAIRIALNLLAAGAAIVASAQQPASASPPPQAAASAGLLNDFLREQNAAFSAWDLGGQVRGRFESKGGFAVPGVPGAVDLRQKAHVGWKPASWINLYAEGRDSSSWDDKRTPEPEEDSLDLHQAFLAIGNAKPVKGLTVTLDYQLFWLADTADYFYGVSGAARRTGGYGLRPGADNLAGSEVDLIASYQVKNFGAAQLGYGHFFRGDYVKQSLAAAGSKDADWFYAQVVFSF